MIHAGTDLKFRVKSMLVGFNMQEDSFAVVIKNRWGQKKAIIEKEKMLYDEEGNYYFMLPAITVGVYYAQFIARKRDEDFEEDVMNVVDEQILCRVGYEYFHECDIMPEDTDGLAVSYERVWTVNIENGLYLCDVNGVPILTSDGRKIRLLDPSTDHASVNLDMTGDEVKTLLEGHTEDGKINTVPEVLEAVGGIDDDTEMSIMTEEQTNDMMNRILNR